MSAVAGALTLVCASGFALREPSARSLRTRAAEYVARYDRQVPAIVGDEVYHQIASDRLGAVLVESRETRTRATVAWVHVPRLESTFAVRQVLEVDGRAVEGSSTIQRLLESPIDQFEANLRALLDESASYNLSPGSRNINFATFPLVYLRSPYVGRCRWRVQGRDSARIILEFEEQGRRTVVRSPDGDYFRGRGRFWIDENTGRIERSEVELAGRRVIKETPDQRSRGLRPGSVFYGATVVYRPHDTLGMWLPDTMSDVFVRLSSAEHVRVEGEASYSNYRRFETGGRIVPNAR